MKQKNMHEILNLKGECINEDVYGVEIEVEGKNLPRKLDMYWNVTDDGSLKGEETAEYVFDQPLSIPNTRLALNELDATFLANDSRVDEGIRAGIHVHKNIQHYTPLKLLTFGTTYYMLEDYFTRWCGEERVGNHFCLRARDAKAVVYALLKTCQSRDWRYLNTDNIRYSALNWTSIFKHGTLEFRSMRATRDMDKVFRWVELIDQLGKGAERFETPRDVIMAVSELGGAHQFVQNVMGDFAEEFLKDDGVDIWQSLRTVQPVAFEVDWDKFQKEKVNPFK